MSVSEWCNMWFGLQVLIQMYVLHILALLVSYIGFWYTRFVIMYRLLEGVLGDLKI